MSQDPLGIGMPTTRVLEKHLPLIEINAPSANMPSPDAEQARALDGAFAEQEKEQNPVLDAMVLTAAGMLLRDIVTDTLAPPEEDEEDEMPPKRKKEEKK